MKNINYEKSKGTFKIKYLDEKDKDEQIIEGTINIDDSSLKTDLKNFIINNEIGDVFIYKTTMGETPIKILDKNISIIYDDVSEEKSLCNDDEFKLINNIESLEPNTIYFQFYYKSVEKYKSDKPSNKIINGLKNYPDKKYQYYDEYNLFKNILKKFLRTCNLQNYMLCCVPSHCSSNKNINATAIMINDICSIFPCIDGSQVLLRKSTIEEQKNVGKRYQETHLNSIKINGNVKDKNILLIDDITTSGCSLKACKRILLNNGARKVICFAFGKTS